jgi:FkbM family methyltransferase
MIPTSLSRRIPFRLMQHLARHAGVKIGQHRIMVPLHNSAALQWLYWRPNWKSELIAHCLRLRPGALLDVGANIGQTLADYLSTDSSHPYIGLEPNIRSLAYLMEVANGNNLPDVTFLPLGASTGLGLQELHLQAGTDTDPLATIRPDLRPGLKVQREWIATAPIDLMLHVLDSPPISLVKIDVEGGELEVLTGMRTLLGKSNPLVLCEVLLADRRSDISAYSRRLLELSALLKSLNYSIQRVILTADGHWQTLRPVASFPVEYWSHERQNECDYLFIHQSHPVSDWPGMSASSNSRA